MANCPACASPLPDGVPTCPLCGFTLPAMAPAAAAPGAPTRPGAPRPPGPPRAPTAPGIPPRPGAAPPATASYGGFPTGGGPNGAAPDADPYLGRTIAGKFQIIDLLGQGGMGKVYRAKHTGLDKIVCIKTLKPALLEDATVVGRFEREAKSASRLNHGNSIQVLDFGQDEFGALYIAMEFVSGKDLRKTLRDEFPLGEERICHIIGQVLSALAEAHSKNVIHRDLKPENIMLEQRRDEPDYVKVLDFGIAKIQEADVPGLTRADVVCGTPLYMSPEQATGSKFDARADLYSIGVILYQLTTGTLPFDGANSMEILTKHVTELPVPPRIRRPEVAISEEMESLILRALDKDANNRPASAEVFRAELLKIRDMHRRRREDAEAGAKAAQTAHKQERAEQLKQKQAAQLAAMTGKPAEKATDSLVDVALPKSKTPMYAGIAIGVVAIVGVGVALLKPSGTTTPPPGPVQPVNPVAVNPTPAPTNPTPAPTNPVAVNPTPAPTNPAPAPPNPNLVAENPTPAPTNPAPANPANPANPQVNPVVAAPTVHPDPGPKADPKTVDPKAHADAEPALKKGDTAKAKELFEEGDALFEEEKYPEAIRKYREAALADQTFAKAYKGLFRAGTAGGDLKAAKIGATMYLKTAPDAPDAAMIRERLKQFP